MKEQGLEDIFKKALENFESDVHPNVWTNVQSAINTPAAPAGHGANGSVAGKAGVIAGKLGVKGIIAILAAAAGVSVGAYYILTNASNQKTIQPAMQQQHQAPQTVTQQPADGSKETSATNPVVAEKKNSSPSTVRTKKSEVAPLAAADKQQPLTTTPAPPINTSPSSTPAQAAAPKTVTAVAPPPVAASSAETKPDEEVTKAENHTYKNDFADIADYLIAEPATGKKALTNVFTPNGDGKNDVFTVNTINLKSLTVTVMDQSGKLIYQWNTLDGGWDGNLPDGRPAAVGNYYYSLLGETMDGKKCIANSPLMLRR